jgi:Transmembrane secretion effector
VEASIGCSEVEITMELIIRPEDREEFLALTKELRLIFLRNGAFLYRVVEILEYPGTFRTEMRFKSWAEYLRHYARMTKDESPQINSYQCYTFKFHTHGLLNATTYRATAQRFLRMCGVY